MTPRSLLSIPLAAALLLHAGPAASAEIKVLTVGAMKSVVLALQPGFEAASGHRLVVDNDTAGGLTKRIEGGEMFDLAVLTPAAVNDLSNKGKFVAGSRTNLARVGVGVVVKDGTPKPDISSVAAFKQAMVVTRLPKTRSGKILRGTMQKIADSAPWKLPATIDDPAILDEIAASMQAIGYAKTTRPQ